MIPKSDFFGVSLFEPLNRELGLSGAAWKLSTLGQLNATNQHVWLQPLKQGQATGRAYGWQITDAYWGIEDTTMTYFRGFNSEGVYEGGAMFGVSWASADNVIDVRGHLDWPPLQPDYYIPIENKIHTPNTGGYEVCVLDGPWPSETMHYGLNKQSDQDPHRTLVITFQLLPIGADYPIEY